MAKVQTLSKVNGLDKNQQLSIIGSPQPFKNRGHSRFQLKTHPCFDYKKTSYHKASSFLDDGFLKKHKKGFITMRDINKLFKNDSLSELITAAACKVVDEIQKNPDKYSY